MRWPAPVGLLLATLAASLIILPGISSPVRPLVAVVFLAICPGLSLVRLLRLRSPALEWLLGISLSLALDMLVAEALLYTGLWSATAALLTLMTLTIVGASVDLAGVASSWLGAHPNADEIDVEVAREGCRRVRRAGPLAAYPQGKQDVHRLGGHGATAEAVALHSVDVPG